VGDEMNPLIKSGEKATLSLIITEVTRIESISATATVEQNFDVEAIRCGGVDALDAPVALGALCSTLHNGKKRFGTLNLGQTFEMDVTNTHPTEDMHFDVLILAVHCLTFDVQKRERDLAFVRSEVEKMQGVDPNAVRIGAP
jgi:hypothetical protein